MSRLQRLSSASAQLQAERMARRVDPALVSAFRDELAGRLSPNWQPLQTMRDGAALQHRGRRTRVIWSIGIESDDRPWLHVSASLPGGALPMHEHMAEVKDAFIGPDRYGYQVWPPAAAYVNLAEVLHLLEPPRGEPPLPEFSAVVNGVRTI